jgi:cell division protein FtsL
VQRSTVVFVVVTGIVVIGIMLGLVALNALLAQTSFRIGDLQSRVDRLTQSYEERRLELAQLASPSRLASAASHLGLVVPPGGVTILTPRPAHPSGKAVGGGP